MVVPATVPDLVVRAFGLTDTGKVRSSNEAFPGGGTVANLARPTLPVFPQAATREGRGRGHVLLVADGMEATTPGSGPALCPWKRSRLCPGPAAAVFQSPGQGRAPGIQDLREAVRPSGRPHPGRVATASGIGGHGHDADRGLRQRSKTVRPACGRQPFAITFAAVCCAV